MALLVYYAMVRDEPNEVEYRFGGTEESMDRVLIIDKPRQEAHTESPSDAIFRAAAGRIMLRARRENAWPRNGMIAS
jgi:hypothetical protein